MSEEQDNLRNIVVNQSERIQELEDEVAAKAAEIAELKSQLEDKPVSDGLFGPPATGSGQMIYRGQKYTTWNGANSMVNVTNPAAGSVAEQVQDTLRGMYF